MQVYGPCLSTISLGTHQRHADMLDQKPEPERWCGPCTVGIKIADLYILEYDKHLRDDKCDAADDDQAVDRLVISC